MYITDERGRKIAPGETLTVTTPDGYQATGRLIGLTNATDGPHIRLLGADRLERRVPLPARVRRA